MTSLLFIILFIVVVISHSRYLWVCTAILSFACSASFPSLLFCLSVVEQCICNRIQADEIVMEWVAYSTTKDGLQLTQDTLEEFEHKVTKFIFSKKFTIY